MKKITICFLAMALLFSTAVFSRVSAEEPEREIVKMIPIDMLFAYDKNLPFNIEKEKIRESPTTVTYRIYFDSAHNARVPAVLTIPKGATAEDPVPVIVFMHGHGMEKDLGPMGDSFIGQKKYALFGIDVEYRNERSREGHDILSQYLYSSRDAFIQTVIDNMRGIDYLETVPEIDSKRIGIMGLSMGTFIGSVVFSRDTRIRVGAFGVGGGDWHKVGAKSFFGPIYQLKQSGMTIDEIFSTFEIIDPVNHAWNTKGRTTFMVNGRLDELVPGEAALALHNAFQEPKRMEWFDGGHVPSIDTILGLVDEMLGFFGDYLKPDYRKIYRVPEEKNTPPRISGLEIPQTEVAQNGLVEIRVNAEDDDNNILFVKAYFDCGNDMTLMYDDGKKSGDEEKDDGVYNGRHRMYEKATLGECPVRVYAADAYGEVSETLTATINVTPIEYPADAHPPVITNVMVPEKAQIGKKVHFEVHAEDPDGDLTQILVSITEIGLTLSMPPDSDGALIQDFSIPDMIPTGTYHFTFQAKDKNKMYSEVMEGVTEILPAEAKE